MLVKSLTRVEELNLGIVFLLQVMIIMITFNPININDFEAN